VLAGHRESTATGQETVHACGMANRRKPGVAPSSLIYPVYSPLRNKLPRVPGQGASRRRKVITGVSGSQTGPSGGKFVRLGIPELVQSGGAIGGTSSAVNWPLNLPGTGTQDAVDLTVPYRFWGLSENLSWLSQFEGWPI
jgi:hypothetical protein